MSYPIISLFTGAGFLDLGFSESGFDVVWGVELIPEFARAANHNCRLRYGHGDRIHQGDVTQVKIGDIPRAIGIIGGPPCQDFSIGNASSPGVEGNRGKLVWDYLSKLEVLRPEFFLFENVEALAKTKRHRDQALLPFIEKCEKLGYTSTQWRVLNALDYGVPQDRSRVFIVGFRDDVAAAAEARGVSFTWPLPKYPKAKSSYRWPDTWPFGSAVDVHQAISELAYPYELTVHAAFARGEIQRLPNNLNFTPKSSKFGLIAEGDDHRKSFKRLHRLRYSPTVAYGNNEVHLHPTEPRRITVREALRLQSVPDWYEFPEDMPLDKMFKMVSNGVAYDVARELAIQIRRVVSSYHSAS